MGGQWVTKKGYSHDTFTEEKESRKSAICLSTKEQNAALQRKAPRIKKDAYSKLRGVVAEGRDEVDVDVDEWEPGVLITSPCDSVSVSEG